MVAMQILFIGDIVGEPGRRVTRRALKKLKKWGGADTELKTAKGVE